MPMPILIPVFALGAGTALGYFWGSRTTVARNGFSLRDRGYTIVVEPDKDVAMWLWSVSQGGRVLFEGDADTKNAAVESAKGWISTQRRALPPKGSIPLAPKSKRPTAPPKTAPPKPAPNAPKPAPYVPLEPLASTPSEPAANGPAPIKTALPAVNFDGHGVRWVASRNAVELVDLARFVRKAFGSFDPILDDARSVVAAALSAALPSFALPQGVRVMTAQGEVQPLDGVASRIETLQSLVRDLPDDEYPFADDLLSEAIFATEQRKRSPFAFRGSWITVHSIGGGFRSRLILPGGTTVTLEDTFATVADAIDAAVAGALDVEVGDA